MLSDATFSTLRMAATLAMTVPSLRVRISGPERVLCEVTWAGDGDVAAGVVYVKPCAFRHSVACARRQRDEGHPVGLCGLDRGIQPRIDVLVGLGDRCLPGDIYRIRVDGGWRHVFPSLLDADACIAAVGPDALVHRMRFQEDPATGVTLVHARTADGDERRILDISKALMEARGRVLAEELLAEVRAS